MQKRNLLLFFVCVIAWWLLVTTVWTYFFPPPTPPEPPPPPATAEQIRTLTEAAAGALGASGPLPQPAPPPPVLSPYQREQLADALAGALPARARLAHQEPLPGKKETTRPIALGSNDRQSDYHLGVVLDPRGAGVRSVVLNKFQQADRNGRPEWVTESQGNPRLDEQGKRIPQPMELVQESLFGEPTNPSFLMFHYDQDDPQRPLDTLGRVIWKVTRVRGDGPFVDEVLRGLGDRASNVTVERTPGENTQVVAFSTEIQDVRLTKTFSLNPREYHLGLEVKIQRVPGVSPSDRKFRYQLAGAHGLRVEGLWYTSVFRQSLIGTMENDRNLSRDLQDLRHISLKEGGDDIQADQNRRILYAAVGVQFFASALVVDDDQPDKDFLASARPTLETRVVEYEMQQEVKPGDRLLKIADPKDPGKTQTFDLTDETSDLLSRVQRGAKVGLLSRPGPNNRLVIFDVLPEARTQPLWINDITVRVNSRPVDLKANPEEAVVHKYVLYNGPVKTKLLGDMEGKAAVDDATVTRYTDTLHLNTLTDYQSPGVFGRIASTIFLTDLIIFVTNVMHRVLWFIHQYIPWYGVCIILLTVMVRGMMFPVSRKQAMTSMRMQALAPELKKLQEKYKDDRQAFGMAQMELFRKHGVNPFGSCWMLFLQMPIFMGLYYALQESVHFRLSPFLWIENLAAPDMLWYWTENIPLISTPESYGRGFFSFLYLGPYLNILPIIAVTLMLLQQKMLMPPATDEQTAMQQKMMKYMMVVFGIMFYKVSAGLCVYFIASSLWGFAERKLLPKKKAPQETPPEKESFFQRLLGKAMSQARVMNESRPEGAATDTAENAASDGIQTGPSRAARRQERERRKQARETAITGAPPRPADEEQGWWANLRRKFKDFWDEVQRQAEVKRQAQRKK